MSDLRSRPAPQVPVFAFLGLGTVAFAGLLGLAVLFGSFFQIDAFERGVVTHAGAFGYVARPGFHLKLPFIDAVTKLPTDNRQLTLAQLNTYTVDNQEVDATLVVQYAIPESELEFLYTHVGQSVHDIEVKLASMVVDRWKVEAGHVNVAQIAENRGGLTANVVKLVREQARQLYHLSILDVQLTSLDYQPSFRDAQAKAATIKAEIEQSQGLKVKAGIEAETAQLQARGEANRAIEAARGHAESVLLEAKRHSEAVALEAQGLAASIRLQGQAQAEAQELLAVALSKNPALVQLTQAQKWNGALPSAVYSGSPIPFMPVTPR